MNNNKGQTLVLFIMLLPLLFILLCLVVDIGFLYSEKNKLNNVVKENIEYFLKNDIENIENDLSKLLYKNIENIKIKKVEFKDNKLTVKITKNYKSIFSNIINKDIYEIKVSYVGYKIDDKVIIEKE